VWQISNEDVLFDWLSKESDKNRREVMLDWFWALAQDPTTPGIRVPGERAPIYLAETAVSGVILTYLVAEEFRTIRLIKFGRLQ